MMKYNSYQMKCNPYQITQTKFEVCAGPTTYFKENPIAKASDRA